MWNPGAIFEWRPCPMVVTIYKEKPKCKERNNKRGSNANDEPDFRAKACTNQEDNQGDGHGKIEEGEEKHRTNRLTGQLTAHPEVPQAPQVHTVFQRPRRVTTDRSRTPPTAIRRQRGSCIRQLTSGRRNSFRESHHGM